MSPAGISGRASELRRSTCQLAAVARPHLSPPRQRLPSIHLRGRVSRARGSGTGALAACPGVVDGSTRRDAAGEVTPAGSSTVASELRPSNNQLEAVRPPQLHRRNNLPGLWVPLHEPSPRSPRAPLRSSRRHAGADRAGLCGRHRRTGPVRRADRALRARRRRRPRRLGHRRARRPGHRGPFPRRRRCLPGARRHRAGVRLRPRPGGAWPGRHRRRGARGGCPRQARLPRPHRARAAAGRHRRGRERDLPRAPVRRTDRARARRGLPRSRRPPRCHRAPFGQGRSAAAAPPRRPPQPHQHRRLDAGQRAVRTGPQRQCGHEPRRGPRGHVHPSRAVCCTAPCGCSRTRPTTTRPSTGSPTTTPASTPAATRPSRTCSATWRA